MPNLVQNKNFMKMVNFNLPQLVELCMHERAARIDISSYVSCLHNFKRNANITNRYESTECYVRGGDMNYEKRKKTEKGGYLHY